MVDLHDVYQEENNQILENYIKQNHLASWALPKGEFAAMLTSIELFITSDCNLRCRYCYLSRHEDLLYPKEIRGAEGIKKNTRIILDWLISNRYTPGIELFTGEAFAQDVSFDVLEIIYEMYKDVDDEVKTPYITVPTNYSFLLSDELTERVEDITNRIRGIGIDLRFSASVEGKYMEQNRPWRAVSQCPSDMFVPEGATPRNEVRDDEFYEKVFLFNKKWGFGFHPMVYSKDVHMWKENFLWFQEKFREHGFSFSSIYLLEVRNMEWSQEQLEHYYEFIEFLITWTFNQFGGNAKKFINWLIKERGYNILTNSIFRKARGTTCGLQTSLYVRMGDLKIVPCHRLSYDGYNFGQFIVEDDKIVGVEAENVDFAITISTFDNRTAPHCETCTIKDICMGGCHGAQLEYVGDPFTPIPTVCELIHGKLYVIFKTFHKLGILDEFMNSIDNNLKTIYRKFLKGVDLNE